MVKYAKIENGEVVNISSKPTSDRTSNLWLNSQALKDEGWLPIDDKKPSLEPWQRLGARSEEVLKTKVNFNYEVIDMPLAEYKKRATKRLLSNAKNLLESRLDPIEQMPSVYKNLPAARRNAMDSDAQAVIAEVGQKRNQINNASTYQEVDAIYTGIVAFMDSADVDENGWPIQDPELI